MIAFYYKFLLKKLFGSLSRQLQLTSVSLFGDMMYRTRRQWTGYGGFENEVTLKPSERKTIPTTL